MVSPVRKIEKNYESAVTVESSGRASSGNQKARGTLIISNEYSSDTQPLIATTRFETGDGKIFRLAESVTVPGVTIVDGKRQPGIVEAVVIADAPGMPTMSLRPILRLSGSKADRNMKIRARSNKGFREEEGMKKVYRALRKRISIPVPKTQGAIKKIFFQP